ncbi:hypothetical protein FRC17_004031, partial [Serendipita sp. 399]
KLKKQSGNGQRQPSVASSKANGSHQTRTPSRSKSAETIIPAIVKQNSESPILDIPRKRRRSNTDNLRSSDVDESDGDSVENEPPNKRRKTNQNSSTAKSSRVNGRRNSSPTTPNETPPREVPRTSLSPTTTTNSRRESSRLSSETIIPDSEQNSFQKSFELGSNTRKAAPSFKPFTAFARPSVSIFRDNFPPPLSQIEQFSSPSDTPKPPFRKVTSQESDISSFFNAGEEAKNLKRPSPTKGRSDLSVEKLHPLIDGVKIGDPDAEGSPQRDGDNPDSELPEPLDQDSAALNTTEERRTTPPDLTLALTRRSGSLISDSPDEAKQWKLSIATKDAIIASLEASIQILQRERESREQSFQASIREHVLSKKALEDQVLNLTSALKQFGGMNPETSLIPREPAPPIAPPPIEPVRSAIDEALIDKLREENSELQEQLLRAKAAKASSDAMVEQVREVALRAEAAKLDLVRQSRIDKEVARNAPVIADELYKSSLEEAKRTIDQQQVQIDLLEAQNRLTGDVVRQKAAKYDSLQKKYQKIFKERDELIDKLYTAEDARDEATSQLGHIRDVVTKISEALADRESFAQVPEILAEIISQQVEHASGVTTASSEAEDQDMEGLSYTTGLSLGTDMMGVNFGGDPTAQDEPAFESALEPALYVQELLGTIEPGIELSFPDAVESPKSALVEQSEDQVFPCLWHPSDDICKVYRFTKEDLLKHIFEDHLDL